MEARWGQHLPARTLDVGTENVDFFQHGKNHDEVIYCGRGA